MHELKSIYISTVKQQQMRILHEVPLPVGYTRFSKSYVSQGTVGGISIQSCTIRFHL